MRREGVITVIWETRRWQRTGGTEVSQHDSAAREVTARLPSPWYPNHLFVFQPSAQWITLFLVQVLKRLSSLPGFPASSHPHESLPLFFEDPPRLVRSSTLRNTTYFYRICATLWQLSVCISLFHLDRLGDSIGSSPKSVCWKSTPRMIEYGKRVLKELIKVKWHRKGGVLIDRICILKRRGRGTMSMHSPRKGIKTQLEGCFPQPKERSLIRRQPCWHLGLGSSASRIVRK